MNGKTIKSLVYYMVQKTDTGRNLNSLRLAGSRGTVQVDDDLNIRLVRFSRDGSLSTRCFGHVSSFCAFAQFVELETPYNRLRHGALLYGVHDLNVNVTCGRL
jgi:hypothetical protein